MASTWDRCYDFLNIFAEKFSENIGAFLLKPQLVFLQKFDHNNWFLRKTPIFSLKIGKNRRRLWS
jgi:hypothetical protein